MNELFKRLVDSNLLTEDVKTELESLFQTQLNEAIQTATTKATADAETKVRAELTETYVADKEALIEALDTKAQEFFNKELSELKDDIENFRDLETEHAQKLVEARAEMAAQVKKDMESLVERIDEFLEERLKEEIVELKEDIQQVKKLEFGRRLYEAFAEEYKVSYTPDAESVEAELVETKAKLATAEKALTENKTVVESLKRESTLKTILESLQGKPREIMSVILDKIPTDKLEEAYNKYIGKVLHESAKISAAPVVEVKVENTNSEKDSAVDSAPVLAEGKDSTGNDTTGTKVVTGDLPDQKDLIEEGSVDVTVTKIDEAAKQRIKLLAGIN